MQHALMTVVLFVFVALGVPGAAQAEESYREELFTGLVNPFKQEIKSVDPISKVKMDRVLVGPVFKARSGGDFDFYRYVTFYNVDTRKERIYSLPTHREECFDVLEIFASYSYTYTFSTKVNAGIEVAGLGLGVEMSESRSLTTSRNMHGTGTAVADHTPYLYKSSWEGLTYLQTYSKKTGKEEFILKKSSRTPFLFNLFFPALASREYPMPFEAKDADWTFVVERVIVGPCPARQ